LIPTSRDEVKGKEAAKKLEKENLTVNFIKHDVTDPKQRNKAKTKLKGTLNIWTYS
jgi:hypothetical protein